jgi:hypothetical protein
MKINVYIVCSEDGQDAANKIAEGLMRRYEPKEKKPVKPKEGLMTELQFDVFWENWPRKEGKSEAKKVFLRLESALFNSIIDDVSKRKNSESWRKSNGVFIPLPATYLRGKRWEDESDQTDEIPYDKILREYNNILAKGAPIEFLTDKMITSISIIWHKEEKAPMNSLERWRAYFLYVESNDYLMGKKPCARTPGGDPHHMSINLEWLVDDSNYLKIARNHWSPKEVAHRYKG